MAWMDQNRRSKVRRMGSALSCRWEIDTGTRANEECSWPPSHHRTRKIALQPGFNGSEVPMAGRESEPGVEGNPTIGAHDNESQRERVVSLFDLAIGLI